MKNRLQMLEAAAARACHRALGVFTRHLRRAGEDGEPFDRDDHVDRGSHGRYGTSADGRLAALGVLAIHFARRSVS